MSSKKKNGISNNEPTMRLSSAQEGQLRKLRDTMVAVKSRIADIELEKAQLLGVLLERNKELQGACHGVIIGNGVDVKGGPWRVNLETMTIERAQQPPGA